MYDSSLYVTKNCKVLGEKVLWLIEMLYRISSYIPNFESSYLGDAWVIERTQDVTPASLCSHLTFSRASRTTLSVSRLWSDFIRSLKSLKILVYLSWHMLWHTPSLVVWVLRCSILGEEALNFLVWVDTETLSIGWGMVGISWLELTASVSGSGS